MPGFTRTVQIPRPPAEVFEFATDLKMVTRWMPAIVRVEPVSEGAMRPGWKFRETRRMGKREGSAIIEVSEHRGPAQGDPPYVHAGRSKAMGFDCQYLYTFTPEGDGTRIDLDATVRGTNPLSRLFAGKMARFMEKQDGDQLKALGTSIIAAAPTETRSSQARSSAE